MTATSERPATEEQLRWRVIELESALRRIQLASIAELPGPYEAPRFLGRIAVLSSQALESKKYAAKA